MKPTHRIFSTRFVVAVLLASLYAGGNVALGQWPGEGGDSTAQSSGSGDWPGSRPRPAPTTTGYVPPDADKFVCTFSHATRDQAMATLRMGSSGKPLCPSEGSSYGSYFSDDRRSLLSKLIKATGVREDRILMMEKPGFQNAAAMQCEAVDGEIKQLIVWDPEFMSELDREAGTKWASVAILAHELAHHHNNDTGQNPGRIPAHERREQELYADRWAGQMLRGFGASREEAAAVFGQLGEGGETHPPSRQRVAAAREGWDRAGGSSGPGPSPGPAPRTGNLPSPSPRMPTPMPIASVCMTAYGPCQMMVPLPIGVLCGCPTMMGQIPGMTQ